MIQVQKAFLRGLDAFVDFSAIFPGKTTFVTS